MLPVAGSRWNILRVGVSLKIQKRVFLFYDPDKWSGNFRISAYRGADTNYGKECVSYELKEKSGC